MVPHRPLPLILTVLLSLGAAAAAAPWTTDIDAARKQAAEERKDLLLSFTGSDWCPGCIKLKERVLAQDGFGKAMAEHFVLVELDYPRDQAGLPPEVLARNERLLEHYSVGAFPTLILADEQARPYAQTTLSLYKPEGVGDYVQHLLELKARRRVRDEALAAAAREEGLDKARALQAAIADYPDRTVDAFYQPVVEAILAADPEDQTGFREARDYRSAVANHEQRVDALLEDGKFDEAIQSADAFIAEHDPTGIARQHILMAKLMATVEIGSREDSLSLLEDIRTIAPDSEIGVEAARLRSRIEAFFARQEPVPAEPATPPAHPGEQPPG